MEKIEKNNMNRTISIDSLISENSEMSNDSEKKIYYLYNASNVYIESNVINNILKNHNINETVNDFKTFWNQ